MKHWTKRCLALLLAVLMLVSLGAAQLAQAGVSVVLGDITVLFGTAENLEAKLSVMCDTLPELYGRKGTLYLDTYKPGQLHPTYIFK